MTYIYIYGYIIYGIYDMGFSRLKLRYQNLMGDHVHPEKSKSGAFGYPWVSTGFCCRKLGWGDLAARRRASAGVLLQPIAWGRSWQGQVSSFPTRIRFDWDVLVGSCRIIVGGFQPKHKPFEDLWSHLKVARLMRRRAHRIPHMHWNLNQEDPGDGIERLPFPAGFCIGFCCVSVWELQHGQLSIPSGLRALYQAYGHQCGDWGIASAGAAQEITEGQGLGPDHVIQNVDESIVIWDGRTSLILCCLLLSKGTTNSTNMFDRFAQFVAGKTATWTPSKIPNIVLCHQMSPDSTDLRQCWGFPDFRGLYYYTLSLACRVAPSGTSAQPSLSPAPTTTVNTCNANSFGKTSIRYSIFLLLLRCQCHFEMVAEYANHETVQQGPQEERGPKPSAQNLPPRHVDGCRWVYRRSDPEGKASWGQHFRRQAWTSPYIAQRLEVQQRSICGTGLVVPTNPTKAPQKQNTFATRRNHSQGSNKASVVQRCGLRNPRA